MDSNLWDIYQEINLSYKNCENIEKDPNTNVELNNKCLYCKEKDFLITDGEMIVCTNCGVENDRIIDYNPEWRFYGSDDNRRSSDPNRCGMPMNQIISESSLSTVISGHGFEMYRKINTWNGLTYKEKSMITILNKITQKANIDNVPQSIIDATMKMYQIISKDYIKRGTSRESLIAACFFNALKDNNLIRSNEEVAKLFDIKSKKLSKGCNEFAELMFAKDKDYVKNMRPIDPGDLIERFCMLMDLDEKFIKIGNRVAILVDKLGICQENNPKSIAVGCIYFISQHYNLGFSKKEIADACHTSEVTVNNTFNQMNEYKKYLLPK
jgi:transcription initiation factor TFIIIB Brf1 subunit/transcription initiation factor TFIIB